jgi:hypothetical protein
MAISSVITTPVLYAMHMPQGECNNIRWTLGASFMDFFFSLDLTRPGVFESLKIWRTQNL